MEVGREAASALCVAAEAIPRMTVTGTGFRLSLRDTARVLDLEGDLLRTLLVGDLGILRETTRGPLY